MGKNNLKQDPFDCLLPYIVSIGPVGANEYPYGSGTLIKVKIEDDKYMYGILTAQHVVEDIKYIKDDLLNSPKIQLCKPVDRSGNIVAAICNFMFVAATFDNKYYRSLRDRHYQNVSKDEKEKPLNTLDVAFIGLFSNKKWPEECNLIDRSQFYDIDQNLNLFNGENDSYMSFFRGACLNKEVENNIVKTSIQVLKWEEYWTDPKTKTKFHILEHPIMPMNGASGASVWVFTDENGVIRKSLQGIIVEDHPKRGRSRLKAIDISYINKFLNDLKNDLKNTE